MKAKIFTNLKDPFYGLVALGSAFIFFDLNYFFMRYMPGHKDLQCLVGANFTTENLIFSIIYSVMAGILISAVVAAARMRTRKAVGAGGLTGAGMFLGAMTVFCPACTIPVVSVFGFSFGLSAFTDFSWQFKVVSIALLLVAFWILNKQLNDDCEICKK